jgi:hypothetical protein
MMLRTWAYGTKRKAEILDRSRQRINGELVDVLIVRDDQGEAHVLVGTRSGDGRPGDVGTITFTNGGPMGGYWRFEKGAA